MAATGARVSELLHIKAKHVLIGHIDLYSKGGKIRRLYIPKNLICSCHSDGIGGDSAALPSVGRRLAQ